MHLLEVNDLHTQFVTRSGVVKAVDGVSFRVEAGETLGIVGESGSGKSVSVLSILGLIPSSGRVIGGRAIFKGMDLLKMDKKQIRTVRGSQISMIYQDPMTSLNPLLTIGRQIEEPLEQHLNMTPAQAHKRAAELLSLVGIPEAQARLSHYPHQFSGGMRQRVMIAMALACNPALLIADEPTTALDVTIQAQLMAIMKHLRDELSMAIIWITHDLGLLAGIADRMMVMYAGHVVEQAPADLIYGNPIHPYTQGLLASVPRLDEQQQHKLHSIPGQPPDLARLSRGCPFYPRCPRTQPQCLEAMPVLQQIDLEHQLACWNIQKEFSHIEL
jgi:oligopeptide transport system ATP-binding protein